MLVWDAQGQSCELWSVPCSTLPVSVRTVHCSSNRARLAQLDECDGFVNTPQTSDQ